MRLLHSVPAARWRDSDPLGNGSMGAMVPGGVREETISLNHDALWSGEPATTPSDGSRHLAAVGKVRELIFAGKHEEAHRLSGQLLGKYNQCYLPIGRLHLEFPWEENVAHESYRRVLDMDTACHTTEYGIDGVTYTREALVSHPDQIMMVRITSSKPNALSFEASLDSLINHEVTRDATDLLLSGRAPIHADPHYLGTRVAYDEKLGTRFSVRLRVRAQGGTASTKTNRVVCKDCTSVTLRLSTATSHNGFDKSPSDNNINTQLLTKATLDASEAHSDARLRQRHIADHQALFRRVTLDLGNTHLDEAPLEERIGNSYVAGKDPHLANLFYQYGRYLLIASSREGSQPANLQGIWSNSMNPAWSANWTVNCNAQFNYRGVASAALPELAEPYLRMIEEAAVDGRRVARNWYGIGGWTFHHNIDLWRAAMPVGGSTLWATFPTGGTWCATQAYDIWRFTEDPVALEDRIWPLIRGNSEFWVHNLFRDPATGHLVSCPDIYFENSYQRPDGVRGHLCAGPVSSTLMIRQLFSDCLEIADRLGIKDDPLLEPIRDALSQMPTMDINAEGEIVQWDGKPDWIDLAKDQTLASWGAIYSDQISLQQTPELAKALERMYVSRNNGFNETGSWVSAFPACTFARVGNGDRALEVFDKLIADQTSMNMRFRPFWMIDGNLGVMSAQQELLLQSHDKHIVLLPALPRAWASEGSAHGLRARGNVSFDFAWKNGQVTAWRARSSTPRPIKVYVNGQCVDAVPESPKQDGELGPLDGNSVAAQTNIPPKRNLEVQPSPTLPRPSEQQYAWHEQERLMFVCLDPCTWQGREYDNHTTDLKEMKLPKLDTDQWCEAAIAWGAKEILFVAKHTGGFCWWQTETSEYSVKNIAWKNGQGDLLEQLALSCAKYHLNIGIYVYPGDDTWGAGIGSGGKTRDPGKQDAYNKVFRRQLREAIRIARRHANVTEVWFDGSCIIDVGDVLKEEAPNAVVFQGPYGSVRWVGTERGSMLYDKSWCTVHKRDLETGVSTSFHSTPDGDAWAPCEVNTTLYDHHWFWSKANESKRKSLAELMRVYYESVGQGSVMLLNSTPNTDGLIPAADMQLYRALGAEIRRRFDHPVAQTSGRGDEHIIDLSRPTKINHIAIREDYRQGERIRQFVVDGWDGQAWNRLTEGAHAGRKHIAFFDDAVVSKLRLKIVASVAEPLIEQFATYDVPEFKKPSIRSDKPHRASEEVIERNRNAMRSNWQVCGKWNADDFENDLAKLQIDLTGKITEAGQWQVKFVPDDSNIKFAFHDEVLLQQGQPSVPGVLARSHEDPRMFNVNRTAVVTEGSEDIQLNVTLQGKRSAGIVTVRRR